MALDSKYRSSVDHFFCPRVLKSIFSGVFCLSLGASLCTFFNPMMAQSQEPVAASQEEHGVKPAASTPGKISGTIVDQTGAVIAAARVALSNDSRAQKQQATSGENGAFSFTDVIPGGFHLEITASGFTPQTFAGELQPGQNYTIPPIVLNVAAAATAVQVGLSRVEVAEIAEEQLQIEEKQRVLGFIPNFYVSYVPNAAPLNAKQKFELAWKSTIDPINFALIGAVAGSQQAQNTFPEYGQGAEGYGKRYGASFTDATTNVFIAGAILPAILRQDPRYFYRGHGSTRSRMFYAIANAFICKGDNGHWQPNYSSVLGSLGSGGISNLYYPPKDRGVGLTFDNALVLLGENAISNLFQEFVVPRFTPHLHAREQAEP